MEASTFLVLKGNTVHIRTCALATSRVRPWYSADGHGREVVEALGRRNRVRYCPECRPLESLPRLTGSTGADRD